MSKTMTKRASIIQSLEGTTLMIPDLEAMLAHWPSAVNVHKEKLETEVHARLEKLFPEGQRLKKMKLADAALFGSMWWPYATFKNLRTATHLSTWLFAWDDELDSAEFSNLISDIDQACEFRAETIQFIRACLYKGEDKHRVSSNPIITDIERVCDEIHSRYSHDRAQLFYDELVYFVQSCEVEQQHQTLDHLPKPSEYLQRRKGSGAVRVCLALSELACDVTLPAQVMADSDMANIWDATNIIICVMNDMLSFKKEFTQGQVDSILPVLFVEHHSMDIAMRIATSLIERSVQRFDQAAERLLQRHEQSSAVQRDLTKFIDSCKYACTGNLRWSLVSGRFRIRQSTTKGGLRVNLSHKISTSPS